MLSNLFRINLPYGIAKTKENKWYFFNREYLPLGISDIYFKNNQAFLEKYAVGYKTLTTEKVNSIVQKHNPDLFGSTSQTGDTLKIYFYCDKTNPSSNNDYKGYFKILEYLSKFERKTS